jgi:saccharopine dehydrogenase-like NADP-dependent oxidoreductase
VLMKLVRRPVDTFLTETAETAGQPVPIVGRVAVEVNGKRGGEVMDYKVVYPISMYDIPEERLALFNKFGASNVYVSLPAIVGAKMCMEGKVPHGVITAECLDPVRFLKKMGEIGGPIRYQEICTKRVGI